MSRITSARVGARAVGAVLFLAVVLGGCGRSGSQPHKAAAPDVIVVSVAEVGQPVRKASVTCIGTVNGTGYLADTTAAGVACTTLEVSPPVAEFLSRGYGDRCPKIKAAWKSTGRSLRSSGAVTFRGTYDDEPLRRRVETSDDCGRALWGLMEPVLFPSTRPLVVNYPPK
jgi:hypothetical protein